jgi:hypothetical protein
MANHRKDFAAELEQAAKLLRDGTLDQIADYMSRNADARAAKAVERLQSAATEKDPSGGTESDRDSIPEPSHR